MGNCNPVVGEEVASRVIVVGILVDCKDEAGVLSGEAGLECIFERDEIGERKVTIGLEGRSEPEGVKAWKSSSGSKNTERQSSQGGKIECNWA